MTIRLPVVVIVVRPGPDQVYLFVLEPVAVSVTAPPEQTELLLADTSSAGAMITEALLVLPFWQGEMLVSVYVLLEAGETEMVL